LDNLPRPISVTEYGKTNEKEDFAEVFAHICLGKALAEDARQRFETAVR